MVIKALFCILNKKDTAKNDTYSNVTSNVEGGNPFSVEMKIEKGICCS